MANGALGQLFMAAVAGVIWSGFLVKRACAPLELELLIVDELVARLHVNQRQNSAEYIFPSQSLCGIGVRYCIR